MALPEIAVRLKISLATVKRALGQLKRGSHERAT
jgi:DNA-binding CsgD family transcriptional regulator